MQERLTICCRSRVDDCPCLKLTLRVSAYTLRLGTLNELPTLQVSFIFWPYRLFYITNLLNIFQTWPLFVYFRPFLNSMTNIVP